MALARRFLGAKILVEDSEKMMPRTLGYVKASVKGSCRNLKSGVVVLCLYDENGHSVGLDVTGDPSASTRNQMEGLFDERDPMRGGDGKGI